MTALVTYTLHALCVSYDGQLKAIARRMRKHWRRAQPLARALSEGTDTHCPRQRMAAEAWWRLHLAHDEVCARYEPVFTQLNVLVGGYLERPRQLVAYKNRHRRTDGIWNVI